MEKRFEGKVALCTGGASGMGFLTGKCMTDEGAKVAFVDINEELLMKVTKDVPNALPIVADIRDFKQVQAAVDKTVRTFGTIDYLINAAGGASSRVCNSPVDFCDQPMEVLEWGLEVNLRAVMYFCHEVGKIMKEKRTGVIVNFGSVTGIEGGSDDYAMCKSGVAIGMTRTMARLGAQYGFRCVAVSPGPVLTRPAMANMPTLIGRAAEPREVVDLILYLCSDKAAFITGTNYFIDGGRALMR